MQPMQPFPPPPPPPGPGRWPLTGTRSQWPAPSPPSPHPPLSSASSASSAPPRETKAAASLALGVLSVAGAICGVGLTLGLPAIVLGALAHRDIRRGGAAASGGGLATAGIVLGSFGSVLFFGWLAVVMFAVFSPAGPVAAVSPSHDGPPAAVTPAVGLGVGQGGRASIVDLHPAAGALRAQLSNQMKSARRAGEAVLVQTSMAGCDPCSEIAQALPDPTVQQALAKVRVLRVDVAEFRSELAGLRMNEPTVPWFYLLDSRGQPRDAISADEWDDNDAENIAPVLGAFVKGTLQPRRTTWRGRTSL